MGLPEGIDDINELAYVTNRKLQNDDGENTGTVFMWRKKGEEVSNYRLKCPYCESEEESSVVFKKNRTECGAVTAGRAL